MLSTLETERQRAHSHENVGDGARLAAAEHCEHDEQVSREAEQEDAGVRAHDRCDHQGVAAHYVCRTRLIQLVRLLFIPTAHRCSCFRRR